MPWDTQKCSLQNVQAGEGRSFRVKTFDPSPRLYWPYLLELLLRADTNLDQHLFGFRSDIDKM